MRIQTLLISLLVPLLWSAPANARHADRPDISVQVISDYGRKLPRYPLHRESNHRVTRAYLEAEPGQRYALRVRNNSPERVGLVIAVDGRNIISGKKSKLRRKEKMYVLGPWQSATYRGWRTGRNRVNEFFFTDEIDSYAGAFGDYSAMGVIAVAAFRDRAWQPPYRPHHYNDGNGSDYRGKSQGRKDSAPNSKSRSGESLEAAPGTGFGDERWSPSVRVEFDAERKPFHRTFIKYEWRSTLCEMGIAGCYAKRYNRFWRDDRYTNRRGYAPYPPGYRRNHRDDSVIYRRYR